VKDLKLSYMENLNEIQIEINSFSANKKAEIYQLIQDAAMAINAIECEFHGTDLKYKLLKPDTKNHTIWTQLQYISKLFR
jgi:hypothetical protein